MSLFKAKILAQYTQDESEIDACFSALQQFQQKAEEIRAFKEEEYQTGFIHDIFEQCLGYTLKTANPKNYNIERESKNETDSKKADAAILNRQGEVIAVIELKDQKSQDLSKAVEQAFNYHNNHKSSKYIIVSNFNELRFYIDKKTDYEKFDLFTMDKDEFRRFYLILNYQSIISDLPIEIKQKSDMADADISKKLYADFADFRLALFNNAKQNNPNISQKKLLRLIQKFCDRIIFILFAEDKGLLKPNTIAEIESKHNSIKGIADISLYQFYQKYFQAIDKGNTDLGIMPYNGGLFADDSELNQLTISDNILEQYLPKLSAYDFKSDISVNILGHIFEQSLSDLEELNAAIDNQQFDYNQSKRKKDGIFYTPEYITQFIVEQTLGKICLDKKEELGLNEEIRLPEKIKKKLNKEEQNLLDRLYQYRNFLLELKIIDPACGSGAFLNQALEYLINEHKFIDYYRRVLENESLGLYDIEISILENNLYGVDINADAVEIAKLSLWLRTAQKGRKLTDLSNNIICANSLLALPFKNDNADTPTVIASLDASQGVRNLPTMENAPKPHSDKEIATPATQARNDGNDFSGSLKAFPQKFDCVIGNPPYVRQEMIKDQKPALQQRYSVYTGTADLFVYFYELGINLLKDNGLLGFICSNKFFRASYGENLRQFILSNAQIKAIADFNGVKVFEDATVDSAITVLQKHAPSDNGTIEHHFRHFSPDLHNYQTLSQNALTPS
ncbi:MAG: Eco57I restriction-modification methylase domain-containing protein, partial [Neisseriaceae bacterium]|nr:Eco57I restriction-modification methylase domain-containing protein [Neisseriaceae bacterium]